MSKCIDRNKDFLGRIKYSSEEERQKLIESATPDQIRVLTEIAMNILSGNFQLKNHHLKKLRDNKRVIRKLANTRVPHKIKKVLLNQSGGFLPFLVTPVLSALGAVAGRVISSQLGL